MTTYTIQVRGHGMIWEWSSVTEEEMGRIAAAIGATPDTVDVDGNPIVTFRVGDRYRQLPNLTPEVVYGVLRRRAMAWEESLGPSPTFQFRKPTFDTEESDGHAGS